MGRIGLYEKDLPRIDTRNCRGNLNLTIGDSISQSQHHSRKSTIMLFYLLADYWSRSVVLESGNGGDSTDHEGGGSKGVTHLD